LNPSKLTGITSFSRRRFVGLGLWLPASLALSACTSGGNNSAQPGATSPAGVAQTCILYPEETEGPYYIDLNRVRQDITEGKPGAPVRLLLNVVQFPACTPIANAAVDIWHASADGSYSGFGQVAGEGPGSGPGGPPPGGTPGARPPGPPGGTPGAGPPPGAPPGGAGAGPARGTPTTSEVYLRGTQVTNASGAVEFRTIYPGWYTGRTIHIHVMVHTPGKTLTSQLYFAEDLNNTVMAQAPYSSRPNRDTTNATDSVFNQGTKPPLTAVVQESGVYVARMTLGVPTA
jgi:protocatechuate 3,4-dioxygenase beta subunit